MFCGAVLFVLWCCFGSEPKLKSDEELFFRGNIHSFKSSMKLQVASVVVMALLFSAIGFCLVFPKGLWLVACI